MLISFKILRRMGIYRKHLIPASLRMNTATCGIVNIIGCIIMRFTGTDAHGKEYETRQIVYVTDAANKIFLSFEACVALGLVSPSFPSVGDSHSSSISTVNTSDTLPCGHQKRTAPPPKPTELPFPPRKENRPLLQKFLLDHYASSCCNICTHQQMPKMPLCGS